jgi:hypothetical protein
MSTDVIVITLEDKFDLSNLQTLFPSSLVQVQHAVDLRKVDARDMYEAGLIGESAYTTITNGRKWHWEFNGRGGVGLAIANRLALSKGPNNLLLFEEDFVIQNRFQLQSEVKRLEHNAQKFDMAVFGAQYNGNRNNLRPVEFMPLGWYYINVDKFWFLHCTFYTTSGRKKVADLLCNRKLEMQIDSLYSFWAEMNMLTVIIQIDKPTVTQTIKMTSTIQNDVCVLCNKNPSFKREDINGVVIRVIILLAVVLPMVLTYICRKRTDAPPYLERRF